MNTAKDKNLEEKKALPLIKVTPFSSKYFINTRK